mmetsp:Transcript_21026/g.74202  ORF Transcript_21026/g.74202 Transcript_21026/m.74202 type:complete len:292 (-) Transcript_21026:1346-2221(-)
MLDTRSVWWNHERHMVPLLDHMLTACHKHVAAPGCRAESLHHDAGIFVNRNNGWITMRSWRDVMAGEQVVVPTRLPALAGDDFLRFGEINDVDDATPGCATLELRLCPSSPDFVAQSVRLWSWGIYQTSVSGCVSACALEAASAAQGVGEVKCETSGDVAPSECVPVAERLIRFVRAASGVTSDAAASLCLRRLAGAVVSLVKEDLPTQGVAARYKRDEIRILQAVAGGRGAASTSDGAELVEDAGTVCSPVGGRCSDVENPWPSTAAGESCGACVTCNDLDFGVDDTTSV